MDREAEVQAAREIARQREHLWLALLAYPRLVAAICGLTREILHGGPCPGPELDALQRAATAGREREEVDRADTFQAARAALCARLWRCDREGLASDRVIAALLELAAGRHALGSVRIEPPPRDDALFVRYVADIQAKRRDLIAARHVLVEANLRLVVAIARRHRGGNLALEDLIQEGNLGLMKAADRFDPDKGFRFATYAAWWITHTIGRAIARTGNTVRLPLNVTLAHRKVERAKRRFEVTHGRGPTDAELTELTGIAREPLERLRRAAIRPPESLDAVGEHGVALGDTLEDTADPTAPERLDAAMQRTGLAVAMSRLSPIEFDVLHTRFGLDEGAPLTHREVGLRHAVSRQRIRQIQEQALGKLRRQLRRLA